MKPCVILSLSKMPGPSPSAGVRAAVEQCSTAISLRLSKMPGPLGQVSTMALPGKFERNRGGEAINRAKSRVLWARIRPGLIDPVGQIQAISLLLLLIIITFGACAAAASGVDNAPVQEDPSSHGASMGVFYFTIENDSLFDQDSNYTSGLRLNWLSSMVEDPKKGDPGFTNKMVRCTSFLPFVGNTGYRNHLSLGLAGAMFTPYNTWVLDPPEDDRPYAGLAFLDGGVHAYGPRWLHSYNLWLGLVGPASGAEWLQRRIHDLFGRQFPNGWETQLENEPIFNVFYQTRYKLIEAEQRRVIDFDLHWNGGFGLGNWYTGANTGIVVRLGHNLLSDFGPTALYQPGSHHSVLPIAKPEKRPSCYVWLGADGSAVARDLSLDGNTFKDSRSVEKKPLRGSLATGLNVSWRRAMLSFSIFVVSDTYENQKSSNHFGSLTFYYFF